MIKRIPILIMSLMISACQSTNVNINEELDSIFRDIATYNVDLGSSALVLASGDYLDSYEKKDGVEKYRVFVFKDKRSYINEVMSGYCESHDGVIHKYDSHRVGRDNINKHVCELKGNRDVAIFSYYFDYEELVKKDWPSWVLTFFKPVGNSQLSQSVFPNFSSRKEADKEYELWEKEIEKKRKERLEEKKRRKEEKLKKLKERSLDTREKVLTKGTKICFVSIEDKVVGYTEDATEEKIKVMINSEYIWDWPDNWYACDRY